MNLINHNYFNNKINKYTHFLFEFIPCINRVSLITSFGWISTLPTLAIKMHLFHDICTYYFR